MIKTFLTNRIFILCVLGSIVRLLFGYIYAPWNQAPDQLAWELILEQGNFHYDHIIHYPHEGGTILISLFSHIIELFTDFSSLTIAAFIIDFAVRFIQISVVKKVFNIQMATLFGLWTIFATPAILPWGTVNFGLHAIASVFPFLLLLLLFQKKDTVKHHLFCGLFLGLAIWFSYVNIILIPVFFLYRLINRKTSKAWFYSFLSLAGILGLHLLVRLFSDAGFQLDELGLTSIRGVDFSIADIDLLDRLSHLPDVVANATMALPDSNLFMTELRLVYYGLFLTAVISLIVLNKKNRFDKSTNMILPIILVFLIMYLTSPFFDPRDKGSYVLFRHLSYIIPLISLFIITGLSSLKYKVVVVAFLLLGAYRSSLLFMTEKAPPSDGITKASGWVIGTKLGHDASAVISIVEANPDKGELLVQGLGWGISASLMHDNDALDDLEANAKITRLIDLLSKYPESYQDDLLEGIQFSFNPQITPTLNPDLLMKIEEEVNK